MHYLPPTKQMIIISMEKVNILRVTSKIKPYTFHIYS